MCAHTQTHACCTPPPRAHTSPYTDSHRNTANTSIDRQDTPIHRHTLIHMSKDRKAHNPPAQNTCRHRHTQCGDTTPHLSTGFFQLVESAFPISELGLIFWANLREPGPSGPRPFLFPPEGAASKSWSLRAQRPETPAVPCWGGLLSGDTGDHQVTSFRYSGASFPQFGGRIATGHT